MAQADTFTRGSIIYFSATCTDHNGNALLPDSAKIYVVYTDILTGARDTTIIDMTVAGSVVTAQWDSSVAAKFTTTTPLASRLVQWSIRTAGSDRIAADGTIELSANEANPDP